MSFENRLHYIRSSDLDRDLLSTEYTTEVELQPLPSFDLSVTLSSTNDEAIGINSSSSDVSVILSSSGISAKSSISRKRNTKQTLPKPTWRKRYVSPTIQYVMSDLSHMILKLDLMDILKLLLTV